MSRTSPPSPATRQFLLRSAREQALRTRYRPVIPAGGMVQAGTVAALMVAVTSGLACLLLG